MKSTVSIGGAFYIAYQVSMPGRLFYYRKGKKVLQDGRNDSQTAKVL
jgi:hypothetical protein